MPKYLYQGTAPCRVGTLEVNPGDIVDASFSPGKRFVPVEQPAVITGPQNVAQPLDDPSTEEAPGKSRRKGAE